MITVYKVKNIPKNMQMVDANDFFFNRNTSAHLDERAKEIILKIDQSEMISAYAIRSKFDGMTLNIDKLSTGCKTVLNVLYNPEIIFDIRECGDNALDVLYELPEGKVCCAYPLISFDVEQAQVYEDGKLRIIESYDELKEWWERED